jgi:AraC family transcriptional regulator
MGEGVKNRYLREEYIARINRVMDYIESNIDGELSLGVLAGVANFSPYHFHRIYRAVVGEPLNRFIQRVRLERAAAKLIDQPRLSITEIALECGFSGSSSFARAFRDHFGGSASAWRTRKSWEMNGSAEKKSKNGKTKSNDRQDLHPMSRYTEGNQLYRTRRNEMTKAEKSNLNVEVRDVPKMHVAYIRHIGPYKGDTELFAQLFNRLFKWAGARDLLRFPDTRVISVYHDNSDVTDEGRLRTSVCIAVPEGTPVNGEVGEMDVAAGKYAIGHFEIAENGYEEAWNALYGTWLPDSGYQPDDRPPFELYLNDPKEHPEHKHVVDIYMPVKPL